jgi:hypothetical protein
MADLTVAKTILEQLGGEHFVALTGAKNFVGTEDSLTFEVGSNPKHVSHVRVTQTPDDPLRRDVLPKGQGAADHGRHLLRHAARALHQ